MEDTGQNPGMPTFDRSGGTVDEQPARWEALGACGVQRPTEWRAWTADCDSTVSRVRCYREVQKYKDRKCLQDSWHGNHRGDDGSQLGGSGEGEARLGRARERRWVRGNGERGWL